MNASLRALGVPALLVASIAVFFAVFVPPSLADAGPGSLSTSYDFHSFFLPKFIHGSRELAGGRFPVWNPFEFGGVPFFAEAQPAVLYPPKLVAFGLLPPLAAYWVFLVGHYVALALGFHAFLKEQGVTGAPAFVGTSLWTFAVPALASNYHPTRVANLALVPVVFLLVERIGRAPSIGKIAWLAAAVAAQLLAGYPEYSLDLAIVVSVHAVAQWMTGRWETPPWKTVPLFAAGFALGGAIAAVQLVPLVEAALVARRDVVADAVAAAPTASIPGFAGVALVGVPGFLVFTWAPLFHRRARPAAVGLVLCVVLGQGGWMLLRQLPGFSMLRFPYLWFHLSPFFVGWLSALGYDTFVSGEGARWRAAGRWLVAVVSLALSAFCVFAIHHRQVGAAASTTLEARLLNNVTTWPSAALGVLGGLGLTASALPRVRERLAGLAAAAAAGLLLLSHLASYPFGARSAPVARPGAHGSVQAYLGRDLAITGRALSMHDIQYGYDITDRIPSVLGAEESFVPWRYRRIAEHLKLWPMLGHLDWSRLAAAPGFLDALDVELVVSPLPFVQMLARSGLDSIRRSGPEMLFLNRDHMGHAWVNHGVRVIESPDEARAHVLGRGFDPHKEVVLEEYPVGDYPGPSPGSVTIPKAERRRSATEVEYEVSLDRPGVLVASESDYPGWEVTLDGKPARILVADYVLRGVEVPAGDHVVAFRYQPRSLITGAGVSAAGLVVLGALAIGARRRRPT